MSRRLVEAGAALAVSDPVAANVAAVAAAGARAANSNQDVIADADIVVSMIPNDAVLRAITIAEDGIFSNLAPGTIYVDMSTVSPEVSAEVAAAAASAGIDYLRAPVSGSTALAVGAATVAGALAGPSIRRVARSLSFSDRSGDGRPPTSGASSSPRGAATAAAAAALASAASAAPMATLLPVHARMSVPFPAKPTSRVTCTGAAHSCA